MKREKVPGMDEIDDMDQDQGSTSSSMHESTKSENAAHVFEEHKDQENFLAVESREGAAINDIFSSVDGVCDSGSFASKIEEESSFLPSADAPPEAVRHESGDVCMHTGGNSFASTEEKPISVDKKNDAEEKSMAVEEAEEFAGVEVLNARTSTSVNVEEPFEEVAELKYSQIEELKVEESSVIPANSETGREAEELAYSRFEDSKVETSLPTPMSIEIEHSRIDELTVEDNYSVPIIAERVEQAAETAYSCLDEMKGEVNYVPIIAERLEEAAKTSYCSLDELKVENYPVPIITERVEEVAETAYSTLDQSKAEENYSVPIIVERGEQAGEMTYSTLDESKVEENYSVPIIAERGVQAAETTFSRLDESNVEESYPMPVVEERVKEVAGTMYSSEVKDESKVEENYPVVIIAERLEEAAETPYSRLDELKEEKNHSGSPERVEEAAETTCYRLDGLNVEENDLMPIVAESMEEVAVMIYSRLDESKVGENNPVPILAERVEEAATMSYSRLYELKIDENYSVPITSETTYSMLEESAKEETSVIHSSAGRVEEPADRGGSSSLEELKVRQNTTIMPMSAETVEETNMAYTGLEELKSERMEEKEIAYTNLYELKAQENFPMLMREDKIEEEADITYLGLEELKKKSFPTAMTGDGVEMVSDMKHSDIQVMEKEIKPEEELKADTLEKMEAVTMINGVGIADSLKAQISNLHEQTSQSITDVDFPMGGNMDFIPPENYFPGTNQEETVGSMMDLHEHSEGALEDDSRRGGRKRGRPPKAQAGKTPPKKKEKDEEDVCFICFDGGDLVVCDRRGCPKVYHPSCVNRDEAFFRSKGKWNCGWHICSICEKASQYMCFTCTYSLCKSCIKDSQFVCVRGNKGLCDTCRSTVILIETNEQEKKSADAVNFDDRSSWEYLFKDYWSGLKEKLSITMEEVSRAKNPWKGTLMHHDDPSDEPYDANNDINSSSDSSSGHHQRSKPTKKKVKKSSKSTRNEGKATLQLPYKEDASSLAADSVWASTELLEFVAHMRNGDKSVMCQFDVHTLLLDYIKQNNLRDPRRKSQIVCDARLETLFGKARVGHFEMLKLLESHFFIKESSLAPTDDNQRSVLDPDSNHIDNEGKNNSPSTMGSDKKQKSRKKSGKGGRQSNLDEYAAIDVHNIGLIYLRRNLMEELLGDPEFSTKVVGSFVRIRIAGVGQKKDMYRLVPVTGTCKGEEKYKSGKRATDIALEILNLSKTEVVSVDSISNQEFTEEECKRLRQSIKCGLINRLKVGEIQEKAQALQSVRANESLESEKLRISHLRDRASEKGHRKELRECVEKLQILNSPEERARRLSEIPTVNADPKMNPNYESEEEEFVYKRPGAESFSRSRDSSFSTKRREPNYPERRNASPVSTRYSDINGTTTKSQRRENPLMSPTTPSPDPGLRVAEEMKPSTPPAVGENEKIWHYKDPSGKIQGPFSMTQLRKWNTTGYFPPTLRIWKMSEKEDEAILLTDALLGKFQKLPMTMESGRKELTGQYSSQFNTSNSRDGECLTPTPRSEQTRFDVDSTRNSYEGHQNYNFASAPYDVLTGSGVGQNKHLNSGQGQSALDQRSEFSMPSPTPMVEPSRYDPGKQTEQGAGQDPTATNTAMGGGSAPITAPIQTHGGAAAWGALMQPNAAAIWPTQPNPAASLTWAPPPPPAANPNMNNLLWMAQAQAQAQAQVQAQAQAQAQAQVQAQAQAQAYPGWPTPVQGGWFPAAPATLQQIPNWGLPQQPVPQNPNQSWAVPSTDGGNSGTGNGGPSPSSDANICRFFKNGHCRKGDHCNYVHQR